MQTINLRDITKNVDKLTACRMRIFLKFISSDILKAIVWKMAALRVLDLKMRLIYFFVKGPEVEPCWEKS